MLLNPPLMIIGIDGNKGGFSRRIDKPRKMMDAISINNMGGAVIVHEGRDVAEDKIGHQFFLQDLFADHDAQEKCAINKKKLDVLIIRGV